MKINWRRFDYVRWAIGGIGIATALWVYHVSQLKPDPSYSIDPNRAVLVSTETATVPDLTIQFKGSTISKSDVTAATVYFWNGGSAPMHQREVLTPFKIVLPTGSVVLDASIVRTTRNICGFQIHRTNAPNEYGVDFNILEPGDGVAFQVIYTGDRSSEIGIDGLVEGQTRIHRVDTFGARRDQASSDHLAHLFLDWHFALGLLIYIAGFAGASFFVNPLSRHLRRIRPNSSRELEEEQPGLPTKERARRTLSYLALPVLGLLLMVAGIFIVFGTMSGRFSSVPNAILGSR